MHCVYLITILLQGYLHLSNHLLIRVHFRLAVDLINKVLDLNRVSIGGLKLFRINESDVFKSMDLTETPE